MEKKYQQLLELVKSKGYWSDEVREFNSNLPYRQISLINNRIPNKYR